MIVKIALLIAIAQANDDVGNLCDQYGDQNLCHSDSSTRGATLMQVKNVVRKNEITDDDAESDSTSMEAKLEKVFIRALHKESQDRSETQRKPSADKPSDKFELCKAQPAVEQEMPSTAKLLQNDLAKAVCSANELVLWDQVNLSRTSSCCPVDAPWCAGCAKAHHTKTACVKCMGGYTYIEGYCTVCADLTTWVDVQGRSCHQAPCSNTKNRGFSSNEACCKCGGGPKQGTPFLYKAAPLVLHSSLLHGSPVPRTASNYALDSACQLGQFGLNINKNTGVLELAHGCSEVGCWNKHEPFQVRCTIVAMQAANLNYSTHVMIEAGFMGYESSVLFVLSSTSKFRLGSRPGSNRYSKVCTPTGLDSWLSIDASSGELSTRSQPSAQLPTVTGGAASGGINGGICRVNNGNKSFDFAVLAPRMWAGIKLGTSRIYATIGEASPEIAPQQMGGGAVPPTRFSADCRHTGFNFDTLTGIATVDGHLAFTVDVQTGKIQVQPSVHLLPSLWDVKPNLNRRNIVMPCRLYGHYEWRPFSEISTLLQTPITIDMREDSCWSTTRGSFANQTRVHVGVLRSCRHACRQSKTCTHFSFENSICLLLSARCAVEDLQCKKNYGESEVQEKIPGCGERKACVHLSISDAWYLSGDYCPMGDNGLSGQIFHKRGLSKEDSFYLAKYDASRDTDISGCRSGFAVIKELDPKLDFDDPKSSYFELHGPTVACLKKENLLEEVYTTSFQIADLATRRNVKHQAMLTVGGLPCPQPNTTADREGDTESDEEEAVSVNPLVLDDPTTPEPADYWLHPCQCFPMTWGPTSPVTADSFGDAPAGSANKFVPSTVSIVKGEFTCESEALLALEMETEQDSIDEGVCETKCRADSKCKFFWHGQVLASSQCRLYNTCSTLIREPGAVGKLTAIPRDNDPWCRIANPETCWAVSKRREFLQAKVTDRVPYPVCQYEGLLQQCDHKLMMGGVGIESCSRCTYNKAGLDVEKEWAHKRPLGSFFQHGEQVQASCWTERFAPFPSLEAGLLTCVSGKWLDPSGAEGWRSFSCEACIQVVEPRYADQDLQDQQELYFVDRQQVEIFMDGDMRDYVGRELLGVNSQTGASLTEVDASADGDVGVEGATLKIYLKHARTGRYLQMPHSFCGNPSRNTLWVPSGKNSASEFEIIKSSGTGPVRHGDKVYVKNILRNRYLLAITDHRCGPRDTEWCVAGDPSNGNDLSKFTLLKGAGTGALKNGDEIYLKSTKGAYLDLVTSASLLQLSTDVSEHVGNEHPSKLSMKSELVQNSMESEMSVSRHNETNVETLSSNASSAWWSRRRRRRRRRRARRRRTRRRARRRCSQGVALTVGPARRRSMTASWRVEFLSVTDTRRRRTSPRRRRTSSSLARCSKPETMTGIGRDYRGCQSRTMSGRSCQKWTSQAPHTHSIVEDAGKGIGDHNYCRNPDANAGGIWCYTVDPDKRWEECNPLKQDLREQALNEGRFTLTAQTIPTSGQEVRLFRILERPGDCLQINATKTDSGRNGLLSAKCDFTGHTRSQLIKPEDMPHLLTGTMKKASKPIMANLYTGSEQFLGLGETKYVFDCIEGVASSISLFASNSRPIVGSCAHASLPSFSGNNRLLFVPFEGADTIVYKLGRKTQCMTASTDSWFNNFPVINLGDCDHSAEQHWYFDDERRLHTYSKAPELVGKCAAVTGKSIEYLVLEPCQQGSNFKFHADETLRLLDRTTHCVTQADAGKMILKQCSLISITPRWARGRGLATLSNSPIMCPKGTLIKSLSKSTDGFHVTCSHVIGLGECVWQRTNQVSIDHSDTKTIEQLVVPEVAGHGLSQIIPEVSNGGRWVRIQFMYCSLIQPSTINPTGQFIDENVREMDGVYCPTGKDSSGRAVFRQTTGFGGRRRAINQPKKTLAFNKNAGLWCIGNDCATSTVLHPLEALRMEGRTTRAFSYVKKHRCAAGSMNSDSSKNTVAKCAESCRLKPDCGFISFSASPVNCFFYRKDAGCPDDDSTDTFTSYKVDDITASYTFFSQGACHNKWIRTFNNQHSNVSECASKCAEIANCGYISFTPSPAECALYTADAACVNDISGRFVEFSTWKVDWYSVKPAWTVRPVSDFDAAFEAKGPGEGAGAAKKPKKAKKPAPPKLIKFQEVKPVYAEECQDKVFSDEAKMNQVGVELEETNPCALVAGSKQEGIRTYSKMTSIFKNAGTAAGYTYANAIGCLSRQKKRTWENSISSFTLGRASALTKGILQIIKWSACTAVPDTVAAPLGIGTLIKTGGACEKIIDKVSFGITTPLDWMQAIIGKANSAATWNDCTPSGPFARIFCDLHCIRNAVKSGDQAILQSLKSTFEVMTENNQMLFEHYSQAILDKIDETNDKIDKLPQKPALQQVEEIRETTHRMFNEMAAVAADTTFNVPDTASVLRSLDQLSQFSRSGLGYSNASEFLLQMSKKTEAVHRLVNYAQVNGLSGAVAVAKNVGAVVTEIKDVMHLQNNHLGVFAEASKMAKQRQNWLRAHIENKDMTADFLELDRLGTQTVLLDMDRTWWDIRTKIDKYLDMSSTHAQKLADLVRVTDGYISHCSQGFLVLRQSYSTMMRSEKTLHMTLQRTLVEVIPVVGLLVSQACDGDAFNRFSRVDMASLKSLVLNSSAPPTLTKKEMCTDSSVARMHVQTMLRQHLSEGLFGQVIKQFTTLFNELDMMQHHMELAHISATQIVTEVKSAQARVQTCIGSTTDSLDSYTTELLKELRQKC